MPVLAVSVSPCWAVPEIPGTAVFTGTAGGGVDPAVTVALKADAAGWAEVPPALVADTTTLTELPTWALVSVKLLEVAPEIVVQAPSDVHCAQL